MAFVNYQFPVSCSYGAVGGPRFKTEVAPVNSGVEAREAVWSMELGRWVVSFDARKPVDYVPLQHFVRIAKGRGNSFRFKDWTDFTVTGSEGIITDGQLYKRYSVDTTHYDRKIWLPVNDIVLTGGTGTVDYATGEVTGSATGWTGEFDCLCRFDTDEPQFHVVSRSGGQLIVGWADIQIVELRQP